VRKDSFIGASALAGDETLACCCVEMHQFCGIDNVRRKDDDSLILTRATRKCSSNEERLVTE